MRGLGYAFLFWLNIRFFFSPYYKGAFVLSTVAIIQIVVLLCTFNARCFCNFIKHGRFFAVVTLKGRTKNSSTRIFNDQRLLAGTQATVAAR